MSLYVCPCPGCPATEFPPIPVKTDSGAQMAICDGECGQQHPAADIRQLPD